MDIQYSSFEFLNRVGRKTGVVLWFYERWDYTSQSGCGATGAHHDHYWQTFSFKKQTRVKVLFPMSGSPCVCKLTDSIGPIMTLENPSIQQSLQRRLAHNFLFFCPEKVRLDPVNCPEQIPRRQRVQSRGCHAVAMSHDTRGHRTKHVVALPSTRPPAVPSLSLCSSSPCKPHPQPSTIGPFPPHGQVPLLSRPKFSIAQAMSTDATSVHLLEKPIAPHLARGPLQVEPRSGSRIYWERILLRIGLPRSLLVRSLISISSY